MMELADLHRRRSNIQYASNHAKERGYPLLVWPEDPSCIEIDDLPINYNREPNVSPTWPGLDLVAKHIVSTNDELRSIVKVDNLYDIVYFGVDSKGLWFWVREWRISRWHS